MMLSINSAGSASSAGKLDVSTLSMLSMLSILSTAAVRFASGISSSITTGAFLLFPAFWVIFCSSA